MVTIAVLGALAGIAIPSYTRYLAKGKRITATTTLTEMAQKLEQHYNQTFDYRTNKKGSTDPVYKVGDGPKDLNVQVPEDYDVTIAVLEKNYFIIRAFAKGTQHDRDKACSTFLIDAKGVKRAFKNDYTGLTSEDDLKAAMKPGAADSNNSACW